MKVSVIVAYHGETNYITDCLTSLAEQSWQDFEVILVCDGCEPPQLAPFGALNIRTACSPAGGVAAARNIGMEQACGEYVYFLDADDYLEPDVLDGMVKLARPDGIVYGRIKKTWYSRKVNEDNDGALDGQTDEEDSARYEGVSGDPYEYVLMREKGFQSISILGLLISRSVIERGKIRFNEELHYFSDIPFLLQVLFGAEQTAFYANSCYIKRKHNDPVNLPSLTQKKDEERKIKEGIRAFSLGKSFVPKGEKEVFFDYKFIRFLITRISPYMADVKPDKREEISRFLQEALGLLGDGVNRKLERYSRALVKCAKEGQADRLVRKTRFHTRSQLLRHICTHRAALKRFLYEKVFSKMKLMQDTVMLESFFGKSYSDSPRYIFEYMNRTYPGRYKYVWVNDGTKHEMPYPARQVKRFRLSYFYYMARCKYFVFNGRQPKYFIKRKGSIFLETWHGTPLKKLVFDMEDVTSASPLYKEQFYIQTRSWDYLVAPNRFSEDIFRHAFMYDGKMLCTGYPRNDILYGDGREQLAGEIKAELGIPSNRKVILYAPTWRDDEFYGHARYKFTMKLDLDRMREQLGDEYVILLRTHYFVSDFLDMADYEGFAYNLSKYGDIARLYLISDVLITDYSSVFFDYANLRRPMLFFTYDLEKYRSVLRGFYIDVEEELPGPMLFDTEEVIDAVLHVEDVEKRYADKYNRFYEKYCAWEDGHAAEKVVDAVFHRD